MQMSKQVPKTNNECNLQVLKKKKKLKFIDVWIFFWIVSKL